MVLIKFGKKEHLEQLKNGIVHFSPIEAFQNDPTVFIYDNPPLIESAVGEPALSYHWRLFRKVFLHHQLAGCCLSLKVPIKTPRLHVQPGSFCALRLSWNQMVVKVKIE